jgi:hypothetical protein
MIRLKCVLFTSGLPGSRGGTSGAESSEGHVVLGDQIYRGDRAVGEQPAELANLRPTPSGHL